MSDYNIIYTMKNTIKKIFKKSHKSVKKNIKRFQFGSAKLQDLDSDLVQQILYKTDKPGETSRFLHSHRGKMEKEDKSKMYNYDRYLQDLSQSEELGYEWWEEILNSEDIPIFDLDKNENIISHRDNESNESFLNKYRKTQQTIFIEFEPYLYNFTGIPNPNRLIKESQNRTLRDNTDKSEDDFQKYLIENMDNYSEQNFSIFVQKLMYLSNIYYEEDGNLKLNRYIYILKDILDKLQNLSYQQKLPEIKIEIFEELKWLLLDAGENEEVWDLDDQLIEWNASKQRVGDLDYTIMTHSILLINNINLWKKIWRGTYIDPYKSLTVDSTERVEDGKKYLLSKGLNMYITEYLKIRNSSETRGMGVNELAELISGTNLKELFDELINFTVTDKNYSLFIDKFLLLPIELLLSVGL